MKFTLFTLLLAAVMTSCSTPAGQKKNTDDTTKNHKIVKQYTCIMHPSVIADKPGVCPKCGMDLVEKDNK